MNFWAKVNFAENEPAGDLIKAFFSDFNPANSITVVDRHAKLDIFFDETPPMKIIEALSQYEDVELVYTNATATPGRTEKQALNEDENIPSEHLVVEGSSEGSSAAQAEQDNAEETPGDQPKQNNEEETPSDEPQQDSAEEIPAEQPKQNNAKEFLSDAKPKKARATRKKLTDEPVELPLLAEIAEKATSFENFAELVVAHLGMQNHVDYFKQLLVAATEVSRLSWKDLEDVLDSKNFQYSSYQRILLGKKVTSTFAGYAVSGLSFVHAVIRYKDFSFKGHSEGSPQSEDSSDDAEGDDRRSPEIAVEPPSEEVPAEAPKRRVRMACMPEIKEFEEVLGSIDQTTSIEHRVEFVLSAMYLHFRDFHEKKEIFDLANTAMKMKTISFDAIFRKLGISSDASLVNRMAFSTFLMTFIKQHGKEEKVKVLDFLVDLQKIVLTESELGALADD